MQYILNKRESIFSKPIVSEVLLTPKDFMKDQSFTDATKHNISYLEDKKKEVKKPRKALFVGLAKLKGTQKK